MTTLPIKINIFLNNLKPDEPTGIPNGTKVMARKLIIYVKKIRDEENKLWYVFRDDNGTYEKIYGTMHREGIEALVTESLDTLQKKITRWFKVSLEKYKDSTNPELSLGDSSLEFKIRFNQEDCLEGDICGINPNRKKINYSCEIISDSVELINSFEKEFFYKSLQKVRI